MTRILKVLILMLALSYPAWGNGKSNMKHYLFAYFQNNTTEGQQTWFAVSDDGVHFTPLNHGKPVIASDTISLSGGIRDPHLLRGEDGWFRMVLTDMDMSKGKWSNRGIVMMRSMDLIHWEHHTVHFPERYREKQPGEANAVWAPQTIYDSAVGKYMVYFSLHSEKDGPYPQDAVYYAYANDDFSDLECDPVLLFKYPYPTIDTDIVRDTDGIFHLFFNTWNQEGLARRQYVFSDIHNPEGWTLLPGRMQPNELASEGSSVYPLIEGGWMMGYDCFRDGKYQFCKSDNLRDFDLVTETTSADEFNPRHGSVLLITDAEMQNLIRHFGK